MKKVLLLTFEYPIGKKYCGGVGQIVKQCRGSLLALGYKVYVLISSQFQQKYPVKLLEPDGSVIHCNDLFGFEREYGWLWFDYIIQHFVNWTQQLRKVKNHKCPRPKIVYHFHSILRRERDSGFRMLNRFLLNQEKMIDIADKILCPSRYESENFNRYYPNFSEKLIVIENTIETAPPSKEIIQDIKERYKIREDDIVSIYVGRLERIKGAEVIINHIPKLLKRHKNLRIFIIGKALEKNLWRRLMRALRKFPEQLFYIRYLEKEKLFQLYYLSHIFINPSLSESFSLATHEGALCNNALLLNRLSVFDKFVNAALFFSSQEADGNEFISKFEYLIKHKKIRQRLSQKAARIAKEFLAHNRLEEDLSKFIKSF